MTDRPILILGGTGKTGRRLADQLRGSGTPVRTAARTGGDVRFDWSDPASHDDALSGAAAVYLVSPALRLDHAPDVSAFLDRAQRAGVEHVTLLSARGVDQAPPEVAMRAVELDLAGREGLSHSILRPAWFMQNFDEAFFAPPIVQDGVLPAPTGEGAEAFIDADDIAAVAAATLRDPAAHDSAAYTLTGPGALSFPEVAERIGAAAGRPVRHVDVPRDAWIAQAKENGIPADYAELLAVLFDAIRAGHGAATTDDVRRVLGREPGDFDAYVARVAGAWAQPVAAVR